MFKGETVEFLTANGIIQSTMRANISIKGLKGSFIACVLPSTPCVLSLGQLIDDGFGFSWLHGCEPQLLLPGGHSFVGLNVCEKVPYIPTTVKPQTFASAVAIPADLKFEIKALPAEIADAQTADDKLRAEALTVNHVLTPTCEPVLHSLQECKDQEATSPPCAC
jgi:hypothetical protein